MYGEVFLFVVPLVMLYGRIDLSNITYVVSCVYNNIQCKPIDGSVYIDNEYFKAGPILQVELCCMLCFCVNMCASLCMGA